MSRSLTAVMLAGRIRPSALREAVNVHVLCLPVGWQGSLLDCWLSRLGEIPGIREVQAVVNTPEEVESVSVTAGGKNRSPSAGFALRIIAEPAAWRGAAGILRDATGDLPPDAIIIVCEAKRLPPESFAPLMAAFDSNDPELSGVVGVCANNEPAGVYAFTRRAIDLIPSIGYFDMKEQFLPSLARSGGKVVTARLGETLWRLSDRETYLATVRQSLISGQTNQAAIRRSDRASISGSAVLDGYCIIESGAVIEDGAVVHDSVVLWGATVGGGAVVSQSVVGPLATVEPRSRIVRDYVTKPSGTRQARSLANSRFVGPTVSW